MTLAAVIWGAMVGSGALKAMANPQQDGLGLTPETSNQDGPGQEGLAEKGSKAIATGRSLQSSVSAASSSLEEFLLDVDSQTIWVTSLSRKALGEPYEFRIAFAKSFKGISPWFQPYWPTPLQGEIAKHTAFRGDLHLFFSDGSHKRAEPTSILPSMTDMRNPLITEVNLDRQAIPFLVTSDAQYIYAVSRSSAVPFAAADSPVVRSEQTAEEKPDAPSTGPDLGDRSESAVPIRNPIPLTLLRSRGGSWEAVAPLPAEVGDSTQNMHLFANAPQIHLLAATKEDGTLKWNAWVLDLASLEAPIPTARDAAGHDDASRPDSAKVVEKEPQVSEGTSELQEPPTSAEPGGMTNPPISQENASKEEPPDVPGRRLDSGDLWQPVADPVIPEGSRLAATGLYEGTPVYLLSRPVANTRQDRMFEAMRLERASWTLLCTLNGVDGGPLKFPGSAVWALAQDTACAVVRGDDGGVRWGQWDLKDGSPRYGGLQVVTPLREVTIMITQVWLQRLLEYGLLPLILIVLFIRRRESLIRPAELPAGVILAPLSARLSAFMIDSIILFPVHAVLITVIFDLPKELYADPRIIFWGGSSLYPELLWVGLLIWGVYCVYGTIFEWLMAATPGKQAVQIRVLTERAARARFFAVLTRNLFRLVEFLAPPAVIVAVVTQNRQRIGDLLAATIVVTGTPLPPADPTDAPSPEGPSPG